MAEPNRSVEIYFECWNEPSGERRMSLLAEAWGDEAAYVDPVSQAEGLAAISAMMTGFQQQYPGHRVILTSDIDHHHDRVRFTWRIEKPDGSELASGVDYGELTDDGRLRQIAGFFGPAPEAKRVEQATAAAS